MTAHSLGRAHCTGGRADRFLRLPPAPASPDPRRRLIAPAGAERSGGQGPGAPAPGLDSAAHPSVPQPQERGRVRSQPHQPRFIRFPVPVPAAASLFSFPSRRGGAERARGGRAGPAAGATGAGPARQRLCSARTGVGSAPRGHPAAPGRCRARFCPSARVPGAPQPSEVSGALVLPLLSRWDPQTCPGWGAGPGAARTPHWGQPRGLAVPAGLPTRTAG